jgi:thiamine transport system permease protein
VDEDRAAVRRILTISALLLPVLFLALFFCYPLAALLRLLFAGGRQGGLANTLLADAGYYAEVLWFTTWQAALSTALTLLVALPGAYVFARYEFWGKALLRALAGVSFVLPTVVVAAAFGALVGPRGLLNRLLADASTVQLQGTLALVLLAHLFYNYSVVLRLVGGFWANLPRNLEEAATVLGASRWRVLREITLPLLLPALGAAALLVFIFCFTSFGVVLILGGPQFATLEVEVYRQTAQLLQLDVAAALSLVQIGCTLLLSVVYTRLAARSAVPLDLRPRRAVQRRAQSTPARLLVGATIGLLLALQGAPLLALALASLGAAGNRLGYYRALAENRTGSTFYVPPLAAIRNSLLFAAATALLALLLGVLAAYLLARQNAKGKMKNSAPFFILPFAFYLLDALFMLPLGTSPVTLGLGFLVAFAAPPLALRTSPLLIPIAHTLVALPFVVRALLPVLRGLDPRLREAAAVLGAAPQRVLREIDLPLLFPALLVGAAFAFTASLGEFGATLLIAPENATVPLVIRRLLGQPGALNYGQALALSTVLMLTTAASFVLIERVRYRDVGEF